MDLCGIEGEMIGLVFQGQHIGLKVTEVSFQVGHVEMRHGHTVVFNEGLYQHCAWWCDRNSIMEFSDE